MPKKLFISNERMLLLMEWAIQTGIADNDSEYFELIGFTRNNIGHVRSGSTSFTKEHIFKACQVTGASADYIFGFTNIISRKKPKKTIDLLREAVGAVELDLKQK